MILRLDMAAEKPIYVQLKEQIIEGIARGELQPGDDLPSVRALAADIGINVHTVNKVYQQLKQEGYIQIHRSRGVIIQPDGFPKADQAYLDQLKEELRPLIATSTVHGLNLEDFIQITREVHDQIFNEVGELND